MDNRYLLVLDVEGTCDEIETDEMRGSNREMVQLGAVILDLRTLKEISHFYAPIRPVHLHQLTDFCKKLLSMDQSEIDAAEPFGVVGHKFLAWAQGHEGICAWSSWGRYDEYQWAHDAQRHGLDSALPWRHLNLKKIFAGALKMKRRGIGGAFAELGLEMVGERHNALADARHIASLMRSCAPLADAVRVACAPPLPEITHSALSMEAGL